MFLTPDEKIRMCQEFMERLRSQANLANEGRPDRDTVISKDEVLDLKILLNTTKSVEDFVSKVL